MHLDSVCGTVAAVRALVVIWVSLATGGFGLVLSKRIRLLLLSVEVQHVIFQSRPTLLGRRLRDRVFVV